MALATLRLVEGGVETGHVTAIGAAFVEVRNLTLKHPQLASHCVVVEIERSRYTAGVSVGVDVGENNTVVLQEKHPPARPSEGEQANRNSNQGALPRAWLHRIVLEEAHRVNC